MSDAIIIVIYPYIYFVFSKFFYYTLIFYHCLVTSKIDNHTFEKPLRALEISIMIFK